LSPCILPLIPVYLANISGPGEMTSNHDAAKKRRWAVFLHSATFVAGFTMVFTLWGAGAGLLGSLFIERWALMRHVVGGLLAAFGVLMLLSLRVSWLNFERRLRLRSGTRIGFARSFIIGAIFPIAWTPCASWALGSILLLAGAAETAGRGALLLAIYSLGLGLPFLAAGVALDFVRPLLKRLSAYSTMIYVSSGVLLIVVGILIVTDRLAWLIGRL
jgi:cytochrome c-type biogenesis protein